MLPSLFPERGDEGTPGAASYVSIVFLYGVLSNIERAGADIFDGLIALTSESDGNSERSAFWKEFLFFSQSVRPTGENLFFESGSKDYNVLTMKG